MKLGRQSRLAEVWREARFDEFTDGKQMAGNIAKIIVVSF